MRTKTEKDILSLTEPAINNLLQEYQAVHTASLLHNARKEKLRELILKIVKVKSGGTRYYTNKYLVNVRIHARKVVDTEKMEKKLGKLFLQHYYKRTKVRNLEILRRTK